MVDVKENHVSEEDDVVISGISGYFPDSPDFDILRDKLFNKEHLVTPKTGENWKKESLGIPPFVGQVSGKKKFDAGFFGLSSRLVNSSDPIVRMALEVVYAAVIDAGMSPSELDGTNTNVISSTVMSESENTFPYIITEYMMGILGHARSMLANRVSYWLNTHGASFSVVSMETCGFEAFSIAYNELKLGRCDNAVVIGANHVLQPETSHHYKELGLLSMDGKCRSFDAEASGYARSEAVVAMVLQKAKHAKRIYATIVNSDFESCGDRNVRFTTAFGDPLVYLMERCYSNCGVDPSDIDFLEAEGTGNLDFDEEEMKAVDKVLLKNRKTPLLIGSVKSNLGHTFGASNLCSIAKVLIAFQERAIPPNLHYMTPSPRIPALVENRAKIVTDVTPWDGKLVALNSMGLAGSYAHVLLQAHGKDKPKNTHEDGLPRLVLGSGRNEEAMDRIINMVESRPVDVEWIRLLHDVHSFNISNHLYRGYTIVPTPEKPIHEKQYYDQASRPVWFIFSGMGSQWPEMGRDLMQLPAFAETIEKCHAVLAEKGVDLKNIITTEDPKIFNNILHSFVGIAAIQIALVDILRKVDIKCDGMIGHSVGELGCAYADGCLTLEQMILSSYYRGAASLQAELITGSMAAVGLGYKDIKPMLPPEIDVACHNSSESSTLSGPSEVVNKFVGELQERKIFARAVNVANIAYHSRYIQPAAPYLLEPLQKLITDPKPRSSKWVCTSVSEERWNTPLAQYCSAEYLTNNLLSPVLFEEGSKHIPKNAITIEIAPHGLLQAILRRSLGSECTLIPLTQRGSSQGLHFLLTAIGKLYTAGLLPNVKALYPPVEYPVSRGTASLSPLVSWDHSDEWLSVEDIDIAKSTTGTQQLVVNLNQEEFRAYADNSINGKIVFPTFALLVTVWKTLANIHRTTIHKQPVVFEDIKFEHYLPIGHMESKTLSFLVQRGSGHFEIYTDNHSLVTGKMNILETTEDTVQQLVVPSSGVELTGDDVYSELECQGFKLEGLFRGIKGMKLNKQGCVASVQWANEWGVFGETLLHIMLLQCARQNQDLVLPASIQKVVINPQKHPSDKEVLEAVYNQNAGVLYCGGVELHSLKTASFPAVSRKEPNVEMVRFLPYEKSNLQSVKHFIDIGLQCALQNKLYDSVNIAVLDSCDKNIITEIENLMPKYSQVTLNTGSKKTSDKPLSLVFTGKEDLGLASASLGLKGGFIMVKLDQSVSSKIKSDFVTVAEQQFGHESLILFKKVEAKNSHATQVVTLSGNTSSWLQEIKKAGPCHRLIAVALLDSQALETITSFFEQLQNESGLEHVRYVMIFDKKAPPFSLTTSLYAQQLQKDLVVNIYQDGEWGSFFHVPLSRTNEELLELQLLLAQSTEDIDIKYLSLSPREISVAPCGEASELELGYLGFSGVTKAGQKVMGVASLDSKITRLSSKPHLAWKVPESWSLQQAASVPLAYATAYYALVLRAQVRKGNTVFVQAGWTNIGQAAIALALDYGCTVYTSVAREEQKTFLKRKFPQLSDKNICSCLNSAYEVHILRDTNGEGVDILLNFLSGSNIQSSVNCMAPSGKIVQFGQSKHVSNEFIGMQVFNSSVAMYGVTPDNLSNLPSDWEADLYSGIEERIRNNVIKPLEIKEFQRQQTQLALRTLEDKSNNSSVILSLKSNIENNPSKSKITKDSQGYVLVVGEKVEQCVDVALWLALRNIHQVAITVKNKDVPKHVERKIKLLQTYYGTKVALLATNAVNSTNSVQHPLQEASSIFVGSLEGVFILPLEPPEHENGLTASTVASLDLATRGITTVKHFVCLLMKNSWSICEKRHREGYPALSVFWNHHTQKHFNLRQSLQVLNRLLATKTEHPIVLVTEDNVTEKGSSSAVFALDLFLPTSIKDIASLGKELESNSSCLEELPSLSPGLGKVREVPPVFIIPGLQGPPTEVLGTLAKNIMYPVLYTRVLQSETTVTEKATALVKHVLENQNEGLYNIVGISWGGAVAVELARQLEDLGHETRVLLIDGAPETIQTAVSQLEKGEDFDKNLISTVLKTKVTSNDWTSLLEEAVEGKPEITKQYVRTALSAIRSALLTSLQYKPSDRVIQGEVCLVRPSGASEYDNCGLAQFFKKTVTVKIVEGNHTTILANTETARVINDFVL